MLKKRKLFVLLYVAALFSFFQTPIYAKDEWVKVRSKNFYLIGNAPEKDVRKVATKLEQFRETFRLIFSQMNLNATIPTNVIVFKSAAAYKPYKPKRSDGKIDTNIAGYFQPGEDVNYITISTEREDAETYGTIFHEYVHFMVDTTFGKSDVPPWFNEGLAEYYQTFEIEEDQKVKLGLPQSGHLNLLQQNKLIPLESFFKVSNAALHETGDHSRNIFYAQAWALIHYLVQTGKSDGLSKFLTLALNNTPPEKAFQEAFQTTYAQMEKDLKKYVAQSTYKYQLVTLKNKLSFDGEMQMSPISEAVTNAYLGDLMFHSRRDEDAEPLLQKAVALEPNLSMANTTYGMVKIRQRKFAEAKNYLEKAISDDQKNHFALYQYAFLLSRESYDEFGYVSSFSADKTAKMQELLKKAIAIKPSFAESYELLAFIGLVNNEQLDESILNLRKALQYQPGNQKYAIRIAEIYARQNKFKEAAAIAEKILQTTDEPQVKLQAEDVLNQVRQRQDFAVQQEKARKEYEAAIADAKKSGQVILVNNGDNEKALSPEEIAKINEEEKMRSVNQAIKKPEANEKQIIGQIQKIECKGKNITYTVKSGGETFALSSKDFENLSLVSFVPDAENAQVSCGANLASFNAVLTFKFQNDAKPTNRGELVAIDFVPNGFRFIDVNTPQKSLTAISPEPPAVNAVSGESDNPQPVKNEDAESRRRELMMRSIKNAMRQLQAGEKRELGFIEKIECSNKVTIFHFKTATQIMKLATANPQTLQMRSYTPDASSIQFGCSLKQVDIPVVFTFKENSAQKNAGGELLALEFVPKSFSLD